MATSDDFLLAIRGYFNLAVDTVRWGSKCERDCTLARFRSLERTWPVWPSISEPGCLRSPEPQKFSFLRPLRIW